MEEVAVKKPGYKFELVDLGHKFYNQIKMTSEEKEEFDTRCQNLKNSNKNKRKGDGRNDQ